MTHPSKPVGVGIILLNTGNEILLILRDDNPSIPYPNMWDLPGGHLEAGETPEETIRREMMEELELDLGELRLFREYHHDAFDEYVFVKHFDRNPDELPLHEGQRCRFFSREEIEKTNLAYSYNRVLSDFYAAIEAQGPG